MAISAFADGEAEADGDVPSDGLPSADGDAEEAEDGAPADGAAVAPAGVDVPAAPTAWDVQPEARATAAADSSTLRRTDVRRCMGAPRVMDRLSVGIVRGPGRLPPTGAVVTML
ncbi:hypothetical protein GCM10023237_23930 [Streptomyces coeruleoprunus]